MRDFVRKPLSGWVLDFPIKAQAVLKKLKNSSDPFVSGTGVWTTPDPIGIIGGINLYSYVQNNPVNRVDHYGLEPNEGEEGFDDQTNEGWGGEGEADDYGESGYTGPDEDDPEGWGKEEEGSFWGGVTLIVTGSLRTIFGIGLIGIAVIESETGVGALLSPHTLGAAGVFIGAGVFEAKIGYDTAFGKDCEN